MVIKKNTITYILSYMSNFSKCYKKWWPANMVHNHISYSNSFDFV